jgi:hypothetical protein
MTKQQAKPVQTKKKSAEIGFSFSNLVPEKFRSPLLLLLLLILIFVFFSPILFGGKTTDSYDFSQSKSLRSFALKDRDGVSLWNPHIFCGLPAVGTSMSIRWYDLSIKIYSMCNSFYMMFFKEYNALYTMFFLMMAFTMFFFMRSLGANRGVSFLVSASTIFSTGLTVLFYIGHTTKLMNLAVFPFLLMMLFKFQKEIKWLDVLLFIVGIHLLVFGAHVQIVFYFGLTALIYFLFFFTHAIIKKDSRLTKQLLKSIGISAFAGIVALLMSFDTYAQLYTYKPYSTRGTKSTTENTSTTPAYGPGSYEYNTSYSFSPEELITFVVPSYFGFGRSNYKGELSQGQEYEINTYFGQMTSVDTAMYMGVVVLALALFALFTRWREPRIQFFGLLVVFYILISFGRTFPLIFNLMYYYFPFFDNFRVPSMILHILQLVFPILAGFGVMKLISLRDEKQVGIEKGLKYTAIGFAVLFLITLIAGDGIGSWFTNRVTQYAVGLGQTQQAQMFSALAGYISDMFKGDLQIAMALLALTFGAGYAYVSSKINKDLLIVGLVVFSLVDLFRISLRGASYTDANEVNNQFNQPEYVSVIKGQNDKTPFRMLNLKQDGSKGSIQANGNFNVYFLLEDFYGYSAVKPRSYQDILDYLSTPANFTLWRMLGVKYIVTDHPFNPPGFTQIAASNNTIVTRYDKALPRVYFVDSVMQNNPIDILSKIKNDAFDPKHIAFVDKLDFKVNQGDSTSTCSITKYKDELVAADVNAKGDKFLFFGTTYLPGWQAFVDGKETAVHKTNFGFQGIVVPQGNHKVEFIYEPKGFVLGKYISLILNILLLGSIAAVIVFKRMKGKKS